MRVDDAGKRRLVGLRADVGVGSPDELVTGNTLAGRGHARQPEVGRVSQDGREQRVLALAGLAGAQIDEGRGEAGCATDFVQHLGDADRRQHCVDPGGQRFGFGRCGRLYRSDVQTPVAQLDPFQFAALQSAGEAFQPPVEFGATSGQPFVGGFRQA